MRVLTNWKLVKRNRQIAQYLFFFSFGVLIVGLLLTNQQAANIANDDLILGGVIPALVVVVAFITTIASVRMTNLWIREPRPDNALKEGLKGLGNKAVLYNYFHLPARHVLVAPQGVYVITTRWQDGRISVKGDDWRVHKSGISRLFSMFRFDGIGNPTAEAIRNAEHVKKLLEPIAPDVPVIPLIILTDPRAQLTLEDPTLPVLRPQEKLEPNIRAYLRGAGKQPTLTPEQVAEFERLTLPAGS